MTLIDEIEQSIKEPKEETQEPQEKKADQKPMMEYGEEFQKIYGKKS